MTKARFWEREGCRCLEVTGHAGFDQSGRDIVCAACSIIVQALAAALEARLVDDSDRGKGKGPFARKGAAYETVGLEARAAEGGSCDLALEASQLSDSDPKAGKGSLPVRVAANEHVGSKARAAEGGSCDPWGTEPGVSASYGMDAGRFWLVCSAASQRVERRDAMFDMAQTAFRLLEGAYPKHVRLIDDTDQSMVK